MSLVSESKEAPERICVLIKNGEVHLANGSGWTPKDYTEYIRADLVDTEAGTEITLLNQRIAELEAEAEKAEDRRAAQATISARLKLQNDALKAENERLVQFIKDVDEIVR